MVHFLLFHKQILSWKFARLFKPVECLNLTMNGPLSAFKIFVGRWLLQELIWPRGGHGAQPPNPTISLPDNAHNFVGLLDVWIKIPMKTWTTGECRPELLGGQLVSRSLRRTRCFMIEGSLEVKFPTIWTDEKQSRAEAERRERLEERRSEKRKSQKKDNADARKGRKVAKHCVFPMICGSGGSKSRLAKAAGAEPSWPRREMKNSTLFWRGAHFEVKMYKAHHGRTTFGRCDVKKVHAVVARSTFRSENVQNTWASHHFWRFRCRKSARRCGAKHISKWKCTKHLSLAPLLEVQMSKKCTPLWREAHFEVKMYKALGVRTTFGGSDVEKVHRCGAKDISKSKCSDHFWRFRCRFAWQAQGIVHFVKSE